MLEVDGPAAGLTTHFQSFPTQDWSDRATADILKQVPHTQDQSIPLAPEHWMDHQLAGAEALTTEREGGQWVRSAFWSWKGREGCAPETGRTGYEVREKKAWELGHLGEGQHP